jgi:carboxypeptidase family protein
MKGRSYMKKAVNLLIVSCVLGALAIGPASSSSGLSTARVEASPSLALVTGTVKDEHGLPLYGAVIALFQPMPRGKEIMSVRTDARGKFAANIAPGIYRLRATAEGFMARILPRVNIDRPIQVNYDFQLRRTDTLVQKRGDSDDYRWIARSAPRQVLNLRGEDAEENADAAGAFDALASDEPASTNSFTQSLHGMAQLVAVGSAYRGDPGSNFFGTNFAFSGTLPGNVEMALIGQKGMGESAPNRLMAIASMRPNDKQQFTASIGYGQFQYTSELSNSFVENSLEQLSVSAIGSWQVFRPLLLIYGFDYSGFTGPATGQSGSVLPRFAVQYAPSSNLRLNAAVTPGSGQYPSAPESFNSENIQASFEDAPPEIAISDAATPIADRSQRFETGVERTFGNGSSAVEASAFYDLISGHGVGVLALPLEASPETQATMQRVAYHVTAMNGAARGIRLLFRHNLDDHLTASIGYSFGRGSRFNNLAAEPESPADLFRGGFFQIATAKLDLDLKQETGTRISTVIRLSPSAVVFAIDPFAGRMSVYDPNINIYVTQDLPSFGLPVRWQALIDLRNLLDRANGVDDGSINIIAARTRRTVRGGLAFRW